MNLAAYRGIVTIVIAIIFFIAYTQNKRFRFFLGKKLFHKITKGGFIVSLITGTSVYFGYKRFLLLQPLSNIDISLIISVVAVIIALSNKGGLN